MSDELGELTPNGELHVTWGIRTRCIHGEIDFEQQRVAVTLLDCGSGGSTNWFVNVVVVGDYFNDEDDVSFDRISVRLNYLPYWIKASALHVTHAEPDLDRLRGPKAAIQKPETLHADFDGGSVSLGYRWNYETSEERVELTAWPQISISYPEYKNLDEITSDLSAIYNLLALCVEHGPRLQYLHAYRSDRPEVSLEGKPFPGTKREFTVAARFDVFTDQRRVDPNRNHVFATFEEIGGMDSIARWLELHRLIGPIVGSMLTMRSDIYSENKFLNQVSAIEGLHRVAVGGTYMAPATFKSLRRKIRSSLVPRRHHQWFNDLMGHANEPTLARRLKELASRMPEISAMVMGGDVDTWIREIKNLRNLGTHVSGSPLGEGSELYWLAGSVHNFARMYVLLLLGVSVEELKRLAAKNVIEFTADRCAEILQRRATPKTAK